MQDKGRDQTIICVVENIRDVIAIENTHQFTGTYHVLGNIISPVDGIGPEDLQIDSLVERVKADGIRKSSWHWPPPWRATPPSSTSRAN